MGKHLVREVLACNLSKSALKLALMLLEDLSWSMAEMVELLGVTAETVDYVRLELQAEQLVSSELRDGRYHFQFGPQQVEEVPQIRIIEAESELVGTEDAAGEAGEEKRSNSCFSIVRKKCFRSRTASLVSNLIIVFSLFIVLVVLDVVCEEEFNACRMSSISIRPLFGVSHKFNCVANLNESKIYKQIKF